MKNSISIFLFTAMMIAISSFTYISGGSKMNNDEIRIEVVFNRHLEFNDLVKMKLDMSQHGIILDYKKLEFDDFGKLTFIHFQVDCNDGFSGSASNFGSVELFNQSRLGFYRDYTKDVDSPFGTGEI